MDHFKEEAEEGQRHKSRTRKTSAYEYHSKLSTHRVLLVQYSTKAMQSL